MGKNGLKLAFLAEFCTKKYSFARNKKKILPEILKNNIFARNFQKNILSKNKFAQNLKKKKLPKIFKNNVFARNLKKKIFARKKIVFPEIKKNA